MSAVSLKPIRNAHDPGRRKAHWRIFEYQDVKCEPVSLFFFLFLSFFAFTFAFDHLFFIFLDDVFGDYSWRLDPSDSRSSGSPASAAPSGNVEFRS